MPPTETQNGGPAVASQAEGGARSVLIVDDHLPFRAAAREMLQAQGRFHVIAEVRTGEEAVRAALELRPGLVLMDVLLPGISGIEATEQILATAPEMPVVLVSTRQRAELGPRLAKSGARAFLQKDELDSCALTDALGG